MDRRAGSRWFHPMTVTAVSAAVTVFLSAHHAVLAHGLPTRSAAVKRGDALAAHAGVSPFASSFTCLGCHDGTLAPDVTGHPVDIDYEGARRDRLPTLRPWTALPPSIRLEAGRVGCSSCHDLASPRPAMLSMTNERSALCFACHNL